MSDDTMTTADAQTMIEEVLEHERTGEPIEEGGTLRQEWDNAYGAFMTIRAVFNPTFKKLWQAVFNMKRAEPKSVFVKTVVKEAEALQGAMANMETSFMRAKGKELAPRGGLPARREETDQRGEELAEATPVPVSKVPQNRKKLIDVMQKLRFKPVQAHEGIHGWIVDFDRSGAPGHTRFGADTLKKLVGHSAFRWIQGDGSGGASIGM